MNYRHSERERAHQAALKSFAALALSVALAACGGGKGDLPSAEVKAKASGQTGQTVPSPEQTEALLKKGAALNRAELARAAQAAALRASASAKTGMNTATPAGSKATTKAAANANLVTVYRFYNSQTKAHFYTASEAEKNTVLNTLPQFSLDGAAFYAVSAPEAGLSPVHRFYNRQTGVHFYTISEDEKAMVLAELPQFQYEAVAYYASQVATQTINNQLTALYRFYYGSKGFHFYSNSATERDTIVATLPQYKLEGVGYYVMTADWGKTALKLPHSGITNQQCYQAGSDDMLVACSSAGATALNPEQDGHRTAVNPMAYSEVPKAAGGGNHARTECVKDNLTGLIWEGKEATGLRAGTNTYTNYDATTQPQKWNGSTYVNPTLAEINAASNSVGYKNYVNSIALCGFTNWRLPNADELQGIVDYGVAYPGPAINTTWFPNTPGNWYWSSSPYVRGATIAWIVYFYDGGVGSYSVRNGSYAGRLVRASQ